MGNTIITGLRRSINQLFPERNYGYHRRNQQQFFWHNGQPYMSIPANSFECHESSVTIQKHLEDHGHASRIHFLRIKTAAMEDESRGLEEGGKIEHYLNIATIEGRKYAVGITPLDKRELQLRPLRLYTPRLVKSWPDVEIEPSKRSYIESNRIACDGQMHPMEWSVFTNGGGLAYLFAGISIDSESFAFAISGISFQGLTPISILVMLEIHREPFAKLRSIPRSFEGPWVETFTRPRVSQPDLVELYQKSLVLLRNLVFDFHQSLPA